ncbi:MAG TPA: hypothetical protein VJ645_04700 [Gaiellaceae bacterium]|nr:hypothetical protein [Gaiellaceae bacterium]
MLATIRPDDWNFPLLIHVLGAMLLVGSLTTAVTALLLGWRRDAAPYTRFAFRTLLFVALPAFVLMRFGGEWTYAREHLDDQPDKVWVGIGFITSDLGALVLLISLLVTGIGARRLGRSGASQSRLTRVGAVLTALMLAGYIVAVWAMSAKPD